MSYDPPRGRGRGRGRGRRRSSTEQPERLRMSSVTMPSGAVQAVTIPSRRCRCTTLSETNHVRLFRNGQLGRFECQYVWEETQGSIQKHNISIGGDFTKFDIVKIHKLINCCVYTKFRNRMIDMEKEGVNVNQMMLFHGSVAVDDIVQRGFDERHSSPGGMFGAGIYFAKHSSKSNQYVYGVKGGSGCKVHNSKTCYSCERKLLLCRVLLGNMSMQTTPRKMSHAPVGFHSVVGTPAPGYLKYHEYVVYRGDQAYPEYLITYKLVKE